MSKKLRIAINAQIVPNSGTGGVETVLRVLTQLDQLGGDEEYVFIGHWSAGEWLKPLLGAGQTLVCAPAPAPEKLTRAENFKRAFGQLRPLLRAGLRRFVPPPAPQFAVALSDGFYESLNCDAIHFPYQEFVRCRLPSVYNPHDLQHLHFPQFFAADEIRRRETVYPAACAAAHTVVAASRFVARDVIEKYGIAAEKLQVIPWSPPDIPAHKFDAQAARALLEKYDCAPAPFALYPAMTWEHKNHIRLLEAVARLRDCENLRINLVCTGHQNDFFPRIEQKLRELRLEDQVRFTGIVAAAELSLFYRLAEFVIVPTLFEAASAPLFEAWQHRVAVACSAVTSLPEQAANAALLFDPLSIEEIAGALKTMASDADLRAELRARGIERLQDFDIERTLKAYRAVYRKVAGAVLSDEDHYLLNRGSLPDF